MCVVGRLGVVVGFGTSPRRRGHTPPPVSHLAALVGANPRELTGPLWERWCPRRHGLLSCAQPLWRSYRSGNAGAPAGTVSCRVREPLSGEPTANHDTTRRIVHASSRRTYRHRAGEGAGTVSRRVREPLSGEPTANHDTTRRIVHASSRRTYRHRAGEGAGAPRREVSRILRDRAYRVACQPT